MENVCSELKRIFKNKVIFGFIIAILITLTISVVLNMMFSYIDFNVNNAEGLTIQPHSLFTLSKKTAFMSNILNSGLVLIPIMLPVMYVYQRSLEYENRIYLTIYSYNSKVQIYITQIVIMVLMMTILILYIFLLTELFILIFRTLIPIKVLDNNVYGDLLWDYMLITIKMFLGILYFNAISSVLNEYVRNIFVYPLLCVIFAINHVGPIIPFTFYLLIFRQQYMKYPIVQYLTNVLNKSAITNFNFNTNLFHWVFHFAIFIFINYVIISKKVSNFN